MSPLRAELARPLDDAELRQVLAATPTPGKVAVSFRREPSFFAAAQVEGEFHQTLVVREAARDRIVALGSRSVRQRYVNGMAMPVGYLGGLRVLPAHRSGLALARGYRFLRQLHQDRRTPIYLTTIAEANDGAQSILTSGRAGLPRYDYYGNYLTAVIPLRRRAAPASVPAGIKIRTAEIDDLPQLCKFLEVVGSARQFFPCYRLTDWFNQSATFRGLQIGDLILACRGDQIVGSLACWDQSSFRQIVIEDYGAALAWSAPIYNGWAAIKGLPKLPKAGEALRCLTGALPIVAADDCRVFAALLETMLAGSLGRGHSHLLVGMHERDPLFEVVKHFQTEVYVTRCYLVYWEDGATLRQQIDERVPYLELGCL
jgi:hypothetical protein